MVKRQNFSGLGGKRGLFKFKGAVNLINLNIVDKPVKTLWHKGANDITQRFLKSSKFRWWPLLIQISPVVKVVTAAFHIKNVARNHVNSSFLQRLPTVKLVWWHFLGLNNNDNYTNNLVNSKNIYTLLLSTPKSFYFAHQTDHIHTFLVTGISVFQRIPRWSLHWELLLDRYDIWNLGMQFGKLRKWNFNFPGTLSAAWIIWESIAFLFTFSNRRTPFAKTDRAGNGLAFF